MSLACSGVTGDDPPDTFADSETPISAAPATWMMAAISGLRDVRFQKLTGDNIGGDEDCLVSLSSCVLCADPQARTSLGLITRSCSPHAKPLTAIDKERYMAAVKSTGA
jgi:hypothetical protein